MLAADQFFFLLFRQAHSFRGLETNYTFFKSVFSILDLFFFLHT